MKKLNLAHLASLRIGAVAISLIVADQIGLSASLGKLVRPSLLSAQTTTTAALRGIVTPLTSIVNRVDQAKRVQELEQRYALSLAKLAQLERLAAENDQLRTLLSQPPTSGQQRFITRPVLSLSYPSIEGGSTEGVQKGSIVTVSGVLIGTISQVREHDARVQLLTALGATPILAQTDTGQQGIIRGSGKSVMLAELDRQVKVDLGQKVVTVGQEGIPSGLMIGTVAALETGLEAPTQTAVLDQLVSFYDTPLVEVW